MGAFFGQKVYQLLRLKGGRALLTFYSHNPSAFLLESLFLLHHSLFYLVGWIFAPCVSPPSLIFRESGLLHSNFCSYIFGIPHRPIKYVVKKEVMTVTYGVSFQKRGTHLLELIVKKPIFAQAACLLVNTASLFSEDIFLSKDHQTVDAKSLLGVLSLALERGQCVSLTTSDSTLSQFLLSIEKQDLFDFSTGSST
jgi:phosphotransferase system HPr (HPr) family protein